MVKIKTENEYNKIMSRIEELLLVVDNETSTDDKNSIELDVLSSLIEEYEDEYFPIGKPSLVSVIKLRMFEMGLNQTSLANILGVSKSRVSDYLTGRSEPTLKTAREISHRLNIDSDIVLGV